MRKHAISFVLGAATCAIVAVPLMLAGQATATGTHRHLTGNARFLRGLRPSLAPRPNTVVVRNRHGGIAGVQNDAPGPAGPTGPAGPQGAPGVSGYQVVQRIDVRSKNWQTQTVACPAGKVALGGGAEALGQSAVLNRTGPVVSTGARSWTGWNAVGHSETPSETRIGLSLWVACATAA
jgi:hypothetical protein